MEPHIVKMCTYQETSTEVWEYLQETYDQNQNFSYIYNLKQELQQIKQCNRTNNEYLAELKRKFEELKMYLPPTTDLKEIQKRAERDEIYLYLSGLDSSYENIRSHILLSTDLPSFKTMMAMIQREEARQRGMTGSQVKNSEEHEAQALSVKHYKPTFKKFQNPRPRERSTEEEKCSHCKKSSHIEVNC
jgi:hypothetical protein